MNPLKIPDTNIDMVDLTDEYNIPMYKIPTELISKVNKFSNNAGYVSVNGLINSIMDVRNKNRNKRYIIYIAFGFFCLFLLVNMGLTYLVINMSKDMHVNNGFLTDAKSLNPISTGAARSMVSLSSESTLDELSQISHLHFNTKNTTLNLPISGYIKTPCPFKNDCVSENALFIYTPEATVVYHGVDFIIVNATERLQQVMEMSGLTHDSFVGRKLLSKCKWCAACVASGAGILVGGAALAGPTGGVSLVVGVIAGSAVSLTGLIGGLFSD